MTKPEGQRVRRLGVGMKPRTKKGEKMHDATSTETTPPTTEGQPDSIIQPVIERLEAEQRGNTLETDIEAESSPAEEAESAPAEEAIVAASEGVSDLQKALEESASPAVGEDIAKAHQTKLAEIEPVVGDAFKPRTIAEIEEAIQAGQSVELAPSGDVTVSEPRLVMPNGDLKVLVTIEEPYVNAVKEWSEADGVPLEQWLSNLLYNNYVTYGEPVKGR